VKYTLDLIERVVEGLELKELRTFTVTQQAEVKTLASETHNWYDHDAMLV
jgi:hypothetical protein